VAWIERRSMLSARRRKRMREWLTLALPKKNRGSRKVAVNWGREKPWQRRS
jgi:hypothetical protein